MGGLEVVDQRGGGHRRPVRLGLRFDRLTWSRTVAGVEAELAARVGEGPVPAAAVVEAERFEGPFASPGTARMISAREAGGRERRHGWLLPVQLAVRTPIAVTRTTPKPMAIWRRPRTTGRRTGWALANRWTAMTQRPRVRQPPACGRVRRRQPRGRRRPGRRRDGSGLRGSAVEAGDLRPDVGDRRRHSRGEDEPHAGSESTALPSASTTIAATEHTPMAPASSGRGGAREAHVEPAFHGEQRQRDEPGHPEPRLREDHSPGASTARTASSPARPAVRGGFARGSVRVGRPPRSSTGSGRGTRPARQGDAHAGRVGRSQTEQPGLEGEPPAAVLGGQRDRTPRRPRRALVGEPSTAVTPACPSARRGSVSRGLRAGGRGRWTTGGGVHRCPPGRRTGPRGRTSRCRRAPRSPRSRPGH